MITAMEIRELKAFFSRAYVVNHLGKIVICFREKRIKFEENAAIFTDLTTYNDLSIGDWCIVANTVYGRHFNSSYYEPADDVNWKEEKERLRIILAFFEINGKIIHSRSSGLVRRIFCATGIFPAVKPPFVWSPKIAPIYSDGKPLAVDAIHYDGKNHPVKIFAVDLLIKTTGPKL